MELSGSIVWLTGASSGIGAAVADELVRRGAVVHGTARSADVLEERAASDARFRAAPGDVTDPASMRAIAAAIREEHGRIDLAILNAGTWVPMGATDFDVDGFRRSVDVNLMGMVHGIDAVLPAMLERGRGTIAGVASVAGYRGLPRSAADGATKAAQINLLESLRIDAGRRGVEVVTVNPGFVETEMTEVNDFPMPFMVSPERAATDICDGLARGRHEIVFPRRMAAAMKTARFVPVGLHARLWRRS